MTDETQQKLAEELRSIGEKLGQIAEHLERDLGKPGPQTRGGGDRKPPPGTPGPP